MSYGFASNLRDALPNAAFISFTCIQRAVADEATKATYYESGG